VNGTTTDPPKPGPLPQSQSRLIVFIAGAALLAAMGGLIFGPPTAAGHCKDIALLILGILSALATGGPHPPSAPEPPVPPVGGGG
jgi:hypothetical protein